MSRSYSAVHVHLIFATEDRRPFLSDSDLRSEMHSFLGGVSRTLGCQPLMIGGIEDHVHVLATLNKTVALSNWIKELKRVSSMWAKERHSSLSNFGWQGGYGVYSVSEEHLSGVRRYIDGQEEHHRKFSFQDEFVKLLEEHGMEWDPRDPL